MIGFPMETDDDIKAISHLMLQAREITQQYAKNKKKITQLILTISPFIPKPRTPFANHSFSTLKILKKKINLIKKDLLPRGGIQINHDSPWQSLLQALLSNGTQETSRLLLQINENKGNFKQSLQKLKAYSWRNIYLT